MQVHARDAFALISTPVLRDKPLFSMTALLLSGCAIADSSVASRLTCPMKHLTPIGLGSALPAQLRDSTKLFRIQG